MNNGIPKNDFDRQLLASNLVGAKNLKELNRLERIITIQKINDLDINPIKGNFDYQHLKNIHKFIFEYVYVFAGFDRADIGLQGAFLKGNQHFVPGNEIKKYSKIIFDELKEQNYLKNSKDLNQFAKNTANFIMELNALHPFREGNGRTQRIFINQLAKNTGYKLDLNLISKENMIMACIEASQLKPWRLEALIKTNLKSLKQNLDRDCRVNLSQYNLKE